MVCFVISLYICMMVSWTPAPPLVPRHSRLPTPTAAPLASAFSRRSSWHCPWGTRTAGLYSRAASRSGWRTCPGEAGETVQSADSKAVDCAFAILAHPRTDGALTDQLTLPLRHGSLGLARTGPVEGDAVYLATAATTQLAMQRGPEEFSEVPFDGPSGEQLRPLWETLHNPPSASGCRRTARPAHTPWVSSRRHSARSPCTVPRPVQTPTMPPLPPVPRMASTPGPQSSAVPAAPPLVGHYPTIQGPQAQKWGAPRRPLTPPRPCHAFPQCSRRAMRLWGHPATHECQPRHVVLRPGCTDHAAPRHPDRNFVLCCAPGGHCLHTATETPLPPPQSHQLPRHIHSWLPLPPGCSRNHPPGHALRHLHCRCVRHPLKDCASGG
jgi:hypothetical protein